MKQLIKLSFAGSLLISSSAFALEPVTGFYLGLLGGIGTATTSNLNADFSNTAVFQSLGVTSSAKINLEPVGGGGGFSIGYRVNDYFRVEGEFLFNINNYNKLTVTVDGLSCTFISPNVEQQYACTGGYGFKGNTIGLYGMVNGFYDIMPSDPNKSLFPYVGLGLGGAIVKNKPEIQASKYSGLTDTNTYSASTNNNGFAVQGILGFGYYMDDFATIGMDVRYLTTVSLNNNNNNSTTVNSVLNSSGNTNFGIATVNITATFALEKGLKD